MVFPNRKIVEHIRREYPVGTRVELVRMHDKQAPPVGMKGTVLGVDDTASLLMHWDNGTGVVFEGESRRSFLSGNFGKRRERAEPIHEDI